MPVPRRSAAAACSRDLIQAPPSPTTDGQDPDTKRRENPKVGAQTLQRRQLFAAGFRL